MNKKIKGNVIMIRFVNAKSIHVKNKQGKIKKTIYFSRNHPLKDKIYLYFLPVNLRNQARLGKPVEITNQYGKHQVAFIVGETNVKGAANKHVAIDNLAKAKNDYKYLVKRYHSPYFAKLVLKELQTSLNKLDSK